jgi:hypothetical protein
MGPVVGMVAPILGSRTVKGSVVEDGLEVVVLASVNVGTFIHDQTSQALTL